MLFRAALVKVKEWGMDGSLIPFVALITEACSSP